MPTLYIPGGRESPVSSPRGMCLGQRRNPRISTTSTHASQLGISRGNIPFLPFFFLEVDFFFPFDEEAELLPETVLWVEPVDVVLFFVVPVVGDFRLDAVLLEDGLSTGEDDDPSAPLSEVEYFWAQ